MQARDIKGMDEMHWKVIQLEEKIDELRAKIEQPNPSPWNLLYDAFELYTDKRKRIQIELLREVVFELKKDFNTEFEDLQKHKEEHLYNIREKNDNIKDLLENLA